MICKAVYFCLSAPFLIPLSSGIQLPFTTAVKRLGKLNVDPSSVTISGFSSGGAQAMQFHIAHSSKISGVGIFSGVPYIYGHGRMREDFYVTEPDKFNTSFAIEMMRKYEKNGVVDSCSNIKKARVYVYHGTKDTTVYPGSGKAISKIYTEFNPNMRVNLDEIPAEHGMPSDNSGGPCGTLNLLHYLINNCKYNGVYEMFSHIYDGDIKKPSQTVGSVRLAGDFFTFDQSEFLEKRGRTSASMDKHGYAYIPSGCNENVTCRFSIALHGCAQPKQMYGDKFPKTTGYLEMAELNNIVMIFPQTKRSFFNPRNPSACWDWMGFTGKDDYPTQKGLQIMAIKGMMDRVIGG